MDDDKYKLGFLSLIFWGTTIMVFVNHLLGFLSEGGEFFENTGDAALLDIFLVTIALITGVLLLIFLWKLI